MEQTPRVGPITEHNNSVSKPFKNLFVYWVLMFDFDPTWPSTFSFRPQTHKRMLPQFCTLEMFLFYSILIADWMTLLIGLYGYTHFTR